MRTTATGGHPSMNRGERSLRLHLSSDAQHGHSVFKALASKPRLRNRLMDKAEVPRAKLHDLRHLHSSICIKNGMDPATLADRLGHSRKSFTLDTYTHFFEEQRATSAVSILDFLPKSEEESSE